MSPQWRQSHISQEQVQDWDPRAISQPFLRRSNGSLVVDAKLGSVTAIVTLGGLVPLISSAANESMRCGNTMPTYHRESQGRWHLHLALAPHSAHFLSLSLASCSYISNQESLARRIQHPENRGFHAF